MKSTELRTQIYTKLITTDKNNTYRGQTISERESLLYEYIFYESEAETDPQHMKTWWVHGNGNSENLNEQFCDVPTHSVKIYMFIYPSFLISANNDTGLEVTLDNTAFCAVSNTIGSILL